MDRDAILARMRFWRLAAVVFLPATLVGCTSHAPRSSGGSATAPSVSPTLSATVSAQSTSAQSTTPTAGSSAPPPSRSVPSSTDIVGGSAWSSDVLVITGNSLGGVTIGMSSAAAAHAAGVAAFTEVGDGVLQPAAANFIPMPTTGGIDPNPGYVVHEGRFDLVFKLDPPQSRVIAISGGLAPMTPSECNG